MFSRESKGKIRRKRVNSLYSLLAICRLVGIPNINQLNASVALRQEEFCKSIDLQNKYDAEPTQLK